MRDAYVLVITVTETRPLFYQFEMVPFFESRHNFSVVDGNIILGARWFAGRRDVFSVAEQMSVFATDPVTVEQLPSAIVADDEERCEEIGVLRTSAAPPSCSTSSARTCTRR